MWPGPSDCVVDKGFNDVYDLKEVIGFSDKVVAEEALFTLNVSIFFLITCCFKENPKKSDIGMLND